MDTYTGAPRPRPHRGDASGSPSTFILLSPLHGGPSQTGAVTGHAIAGPPPALEQPVFTNLQVSGDTSVPVVRPLAVSPIRPLSHLSLLSTVADRRLHRCSARLGAKVLLNHDVLARQALATEARFVPDELALAPVSLPWSGLSNSTKGVGPRDEGDVEGHFGRSGKRDPMSHGVGCRSADGGRPVTR